MKWLDTISKLYVVTQLSMIALMKKPYFPHDTIEVISILVPNSQHPRNK